MKGADKNLIGGMRMTEQIKNDIPQFVACGLEMGNCPRQIPYDMAEHERIIITELLDKVAHELKETFNNECPINYTSTQPFFTLENVRTLVDMVIAEMKAEGKDMKQPFLSLRAKIYTQNAGRWSLFSHRMGVYCEFFATFAAVTGADGEQTLSPVHYTLASGQEFTY